MNLEIIGKIGEHNAQFYDMYLKGILCESELKKLVGHRNYIFLCTLRQQKEQSITH